MSHSINLYNPTLRKRKPLFLASHMVLGLMLVLVGGIALYAYAIYVKQDLNRQETKLSKIRDNAQTQLTILATNLTAKPSSRNLAHEIQDCEQQLLHRHQFFLALSGRIARNHGYSRYLRAFARQSLEGLWLSAFSIAAMDEHLQIRGYTMRAELIPRYLQRLSQESALQGKHFATLDLTQVSLKSLTSNVSPYQAIAFTLDSREKDQPK